MDRSHIRKQFFHLFKYPSLCKHKAMTPVITHTFVDATKKHSTSSQDRNQMVFSGGAKLLQLVVALLSRRGQLTGCPHPGCEPASGFSTSSKFYFK